MGALVLVCVWLGVAKFEGDDTMVRVSLREGDAPDSRADLEGVTEDDSVRAAVALLDAPREAVAERVGVTDEVGVLVGVEPKVREEEGVRGIDPEAEMDAGGVGVSADVGVSTGVRVSEAPIDALAEGVPVRVEALEGVSPGVPVPVAEMPEVADPVGLCDTLEVALGGGVPEGVLAAVPVRERLWG